MPLLKHCIDCDKPFHTEYEKMTYTQVCNSCACKDKKKEKESSMYNETIIKLEAKRDALEYARQVVDSILHQEIEQNGQLIHREKDKLKQMIVSSGTTIQQKIN